MQFKSAIQVFLMVLLLAVNTTDVFGHNPSHSGTTLHQTEDDKWVLQVSASLTSFETEVHNKFGENSYTTPEEFNALVVKLLLENINVSFNGLDNIQLTEPKVILGHETKVAFLIDKTPTTINLLVIKNSCFGNIYKNQGLLIVASKDGGNQKFTLTNDNNHTVKLKTVDSKFEIVETPQKAQANSSLIWIVGSLFVVGFILFGFKKYQNSNI
ncbi:hypothetical protein AAFN75_08235 [Algibacter sp. AS12]|uniref:hypothetical protein n=1 Tax=Algibacter sp. AS12 TaxID=3135773 RepID=UPI00398A5728